MLLLGALIVASTTAPGAAGSSNPLALAEKGQLQCYRPDVQKKTCQSIASYLRTGPATYDNKAMIPVSGDATLETHTAVMIKGDAVCGSIRAQDLAAGTLRIGGRVIDPDTAKPILDAIARSMAPIVDKEICTTYEPSGAEFTAKISIAGSYLPDQDHSVKWIDSADGYVVTP